MSATERKRPATGGVAASPSQQRQTLVNWLREWTVEQALAGGEEETARASAPLRRRARRRRPVRAGEVRLLPPDISGDRLRYFLVLEAPSDGPIRVAPFSRFGVPAIPGEWRTGHRAPALAVLCVWNVLTLPRAIGEHAWPVTDFGAERLEKARKLAAEYLAPDLDPPAGWAESVGPPLRHPEDPRWRYLREEAEGWERLASRANESAATGPLLLRDGGGADTGTATSLPLAAEPRGSYRTPAKKGGEKPEDRG